MQEDLDPQILPCSRLCSGLRWLQGFSQASKIVILLFQALKYCVIAAGIHLRLSAENPQVGPLRMSHHGKFVIEPTVDDPIIT